MSASSAAFLRAAHDVRGVTISWDLHTPDHYHVRVAFEDAMRSTDLLITRRELMETPRPPHGIALWPLLIAAKLDELHKRRPTVLLPLE